MVSGPGDYFHAHTDFPILVGSEGESTFTFLICLQAAEEGGDLVLGHGGSRDCAHYTRGCAMLLAHCMTHAGAPVRTGRKILLKFDALSSERLWLVDVPGPNGRQQKILPEATFSRLGALAAQARFEGCLDCALSSDLVDADELDELVGFYTHGLLCPADDSLQLRDCLGRLSCAESALQRDAFAELASTGLTLLPADIAWSVVVSSPFPISPLFVASSHRRSAGAAGERLLAWCATDFSGVRLFSSPFVTPETTQMLSWSDAGEVASAVFEHALARLECFADRRADWRQKPILSHLELRDVLVDRRPALPALSVAAVASAARLQQKQTAESYGLATEVREECNDGESYLSRGYESVLLRRGLFLVSAAHPAWNEGRGDDEGWRVVGKVDAGRHGLKTRARQE